MTAIESHPDLVSIRDQIEPGLVDLLGAAYAPLFPRNPYAAQHMCRVGTYAGLYARHAGMNEAGVKHSALSGYLHDIGKGSELYLAWLSKQPNIRSCRDEGYRSHIFEGIRVLNGLHLSSFGIDLETEEIIRFIILNHHVDIRKIPDGLTTLPVCKDVDHILRVLQAVIVGDKLDYFTAKGLPLRVACDKVIGLFGENSTHTTLQDFSEEICNSELPGLNLSLNRLLI